MKTIIKLDSHQLSAFQRCPRSYFLSYKRHRALPVDKMAFQKGTAMHDLLYHFYMTKIKEGIFEDCVKAALENAAPSYSILAPDMTKQLILMKFAQYCQYYRKESIKPIAVEIGFSKKFYEDEQFLFIYEGKIDFLAEIERGKLAWIDHKTESRKSDLVAERNQFLGYSWAIDCNTGMVNYIGLQESYAPKDAFRRKIATYKQGLVKEWYEMTLRSFFQLATLRDEMRNYDKRRTGCEGKYGACEFVRVCAETSTNIIEGILEREYKEKEIWSPWE